MYLEKIKGCNQLLSGLVKAKNIKLQMLKQNTI